MNKLPVWNTAWRGIIFPVTHFVPLVRRLALTIAFLAALLVFQMAVLPSLFLSGTLSAEMLVLAGFILVPLYVVLYLNLFTGPLGVAIGTPEGRKLFGLGKVELLFVGYMLLLVCGYMISYLPILIFVGAGAMLAGQDSGNTGAAIGMIFLLVPVILAFWVWLIVRLLPVLGVIADQKRLGLAQAWRMSRGNWWRIFACGLILSAAYFVLASPLAYMWFTNVMPQMLALQQAGLPPEAQLAAMMNIFASSGYIGVAYAVWTLLALISQYGLTGFIYTALKGQGEAPEPAATETDAAPVTA
ncbi:hypothetical protein ACSHT0_02410 [Tepidicaulis sp. LMO-SS28]|uniref:hypothetical protein n=1 Tax=Tepidicaulis sp. LMO-SS28 TaxID=3447455 RepID=UPI003EE31A9E